jgi:hypothetical protein
MFAVRDRQAWTEEALLKDIVCDYRNDYCALVAMVNRQTLLGSGCRYDASDNPNVHFRAQSSSNARILNQCVQFVRLLANV